MDYAALKAVHVSSVAATYALFLMRGIWMMHTPHMLARRWVRIVPHVIDTLLLASAIALTVTIREYPFVAGWLTAKVIALLVYIVLGSLALRRGRSKRVRVGAWLAAQAVFSYNVAVALTHNPVPWAAPG
jgi:uncharacterized membrane protein SirB2